MKFESIKKIRLNTKQIMILAIGIMMIAAMFFLTRITTGDGIYSILDPSGKIDRPIFMKITINFLNLNEFADMIGKDNDSYNEQILISDLIVVNYGKNSWVCDKRIRKAYSLCPAVDMFGKKYFVRVLPAEKSDIDISSLNGTYICKSFISDDFMEYGVSRVATVYITECRKINRLFTKAVNKVIKNEVHYPQKDGWINYVSIRYPHRKMPEKEFGRTLCYSYPNGLRVFLAGKTELEECIKNGKIDEQLFNTRIANQNHLVGETPCYVARFLSRGEIYIIYEILSPEKRLTHDGEAFEIIYEQPGNMYRILRGYYFDYSLRNKSPNYLSVSLFQLDGLKFADIIDLIGSEKRFKTDVELFDLFIKPVLKQARKEGADSAYDRETCLEVLYRCGKLNIRTQTGNYAFSVSLRKDGKPSIITYGRCTELIFRDEEVLKKLPDFIYR